MHHSESIMRFLLLVAPAVLGSYSPIKSAEMLEEYNDICNSANQIEIARKFWSAKPPGVTLVTLEDAQKLLFKKSIVVSELKNDIITQSFCGEAAVWMEEVSDALLPENSTFAANLISAYTHTLGLRGYVEHSSPDLNEAAEFLIHTYLAPHFDVSHLVYMWRHVLKREPAGVEQFVNMILGYRKAVELYNHSGDWRQTAPRKGCVFSPKYALITLVAHYANAEILTRPAAIPEVALLELPITLTDSGAQVLENKLLTLREVKDFRSLGQQWAWKKGAHIRDYASLIKQESMKTSHDKLTKDLIGQLFVLAWIGALSCVQGDTLYKMAAEVVSKPNQPSAVELQALLISARKCNKNTEL